MTPLCHAVASRRHARLRDGDQRSSCLRGRRRPRARLGRPARCGSVQFRLGRAAHWCQSIGRFSADCVDDLNRRIFPEYCLEHLSGWTVIVRDHLRTPFACSRTLLSPPTALWPNPTGWKSVCDHLECPDDTLCQAAFRILEMDAIAVATRSRKPKYFGRGHRMRKRQQFPCYRLWLGER